MSDVYELKVDMDHLGERMTAVEISMGKLTTSVETLITEERANRAAIQGNGTPGLRTEVAVLKQDVTDIKAELIETRADRKWLWRTALAGLLLPLLIAALIFTAKQITRPATIPQTAPVAAPQR